jgi:hypothetical protein
MEYFELGLMAISMLGAFVGVIGGLGCAFSTAKKEKYVAVAFYGFFAAIAAGCGSILLSTTEIFINFFS